MKFPLLRIVRAIFGVLGTHGPAFSRIESKIDQLMKERAHLKELAIEIDAELLGWIREACERA